MLDRLSLGFVSLPESAYDLILVLTDADDARTEGRNLLNREVLGLLVKALKPAGRLRSQDGQLGSNAGQERNEAILAGLVYEDGQGFFKPDYGVQVSVPLKFRKTKGVAQAAGGLYGRNGDSVSLPLNGKRKSEDMANSAPIGVGFVDFSDDLGQPVVDSDDELIDEDTLLDEEDLKRPVQIRKRPLYSCYEQALIQYPATECKPKAKRRRACKDCTCGLAQKLAVEDKAKRANADQALSALKLQADDLAEVDFTVKGKVGSCGNCRYCIRTLQE